MWRLIKRYKLLYLIMLPGIVYFIIFRYLPIYGVTLAFKDYKISLRILGSPWVGLANFRRLFAGSTFGQLVRNTILLNFLRLLFGFPTAIILAHWMLLFPPMAFIRCPRPRSGRTCNGCSAPHPKAQGGDW